MGMTKALQERIILSNYVKNHNTKFVCVRYGNVVGILFAGRSLNSININCIVPLEYIESELMSYFGNK